MGIIVFRECRHISTAAKDGVGNWIVSCLRVSVFGNMQMCSEGVGKYWGSIG